MDTMLQELITYLKEVSPAVWETLMRQVYMNAIIAIIWGVAGLVLFVACLMLVRKAYKKVQEAPRWDAVGSEMIIMFGSVGAGIGIVGFLICITSAIPMLLNPQYYAIELILQNLR